MSNEVVISCPVVGSTTLAVIAEVALMEATVHLLDLLVAVPRPDGGDRSPRRAARSSGRYAGDPVTIVTPVTAN